jgi:TolB-like protein/class 3 adenylate cyclase/tetratricopeptide (TPR) repeat protein
MASNDALISAQSARVTRTVLMVDIKDSVRLMEEDEVDTVQRWLRLVKQVESTVLPPHGGRLVKSQGDGMLLEFQTVRPALQAAFAIQHAAAQANAGVPPQRQMHLKMGAQVGELIADERDVYGHDVNLAARLATLAGGGEIVVSSNVRDQLTPALDADIEDLGERRLKNVQQPIRAFRAWPPGLAARRSVSPKARMGDRPSIAVLPFRNLSGDAQHDMLGEVIADDVIGHLSRVAELAVISRLSTTPFRDLAYEPANIAEVLCVRYLLTGKMQFAGARLRLTTELIEAEGGRVVWADRFDGSITDIFDLQDEMSLSVAKRIVPFVRELELKRARTHRPEHLTAYERTLQAVDFLHRGSPADMEQARMMLEAAIQSDPSFVAPYAWLARLYVLRVGQGWSPDVQHDASAARRLVDSALEKDGTDPWVLSVSGLVAAYLDKDLETGIANFDKALNVNPSSASAWVWSTSAHAWLGQGDEAVKRSHRAIELSPFDPHMYAFTSIAGTAYAVAGRYDRAIDYCRRSLRENRMFASTHRILTIALALSGQVEEARQAAGELLAIEPALTVNRFRNRYPGNTSAHIDAFCEALATAGVPRH